VGKIIFLFLFILIGFGNGFCQNEKERVGENNPTTMSGSLFNYADKNKVNIEVNIWGFVKNPGKYIIPKGSTVQDLISYAGGPTIETKLEEIRLYRPKNDSLGITEDKIINLNYDDFLWSETVNTKKLINPVLEAGDILVFPGGPKYFFRDNIYLVSSFLTVLFTFLTLLVTIKWIK
jgi:Na+-transporting methylmalonyl-CoA/oxaloacetate decarboxylase gamma subunit